MLDTLERLSKIKAPVCATIVLNTHKTAPDNKKDPILLKNLISRASKRLENEYGAEISKRFTKKLNDLANDIDHSKNDNGLILFVNEDISEYLRLSTHSTPRVILDDTFATRSIIRALKKDTNYYILAVSKGNARFIEASSDNLVREFDTEGFPYTDDELISLSKAETHHASRVTNLTNEFFNRVDKSVNAIRSNNPLPIVIYSEDTNFHQYMKEADHPDTILGHVVQTNFDAKASNLIKEVWPNIRELTLNKNRSRISELEEALSTGKFLSDLNEIWRAIQNGRAQTIFVEEGYFQPVKNEDGVFTPISPDDISHKDDINDIVDDMIEQTLQMGGDVIFLEKDSLKKFNKLALVVRY